MSMILLVFVILLNVGISYWNARVCGQAWAEAKALGGWLRLTIWCAAAQSAIGFSMLYMGLLALIAAGSGFLPHKYINGMMSLWYLAVIIPLIGTGLVLTIQSWITAYRERDLASMGTAAWNTFAQAHNMYGAVDGIGQAFGNLKGLFSSDDDEDNGYLVAMFVLVGVALGAGALTTYVIIQKYAGTLAVPTQANARFARS